jgi:BMFP domain-containing protein YqiC
LVRANYLRASKQGAIQVEDKNHVTCSVMRGALKFSLTRQMRQENLMQPQFIDDLAQRLAAALPQGAAALRQDLESNFRAVLQSGLAKLDLVTRREFDVQAGVLKRTREKLEMLETRLAELQTALAQQSPQR